MTTTAHTPAAARPAPNSMRRTSLAAGILYLLTFVSIPTLFLYNPVRDNADDDALVAWAPVPRPVAGRTVLPGRHRRRRPHRRAACLR